MHVILSNVAVMAIAVIFYMWRSYDFHVRTLKHRRLRERVAYMLWRLAEGVDVEQPVGVE
jgi:hypothetical protein